VTAYLDHASAWPPSPAVRDAMARWIGHAGSPMSVHEHARGPHEAIEQAREAVAAITGWPPESVVLTSGAIEARSLALKGSAGVRGAAGPEIAADPLAHGSALAAARSLTRRGGELRLAEVDGTGDVPEPALRQAADGADIIVLTHGQAEVGTVRDVTTQVGVARAVASAATLVLDAGETAGLIPIPDGLGADMVVIDGRSLGGPAWAGALLVRPGTLLHPLIEGGPEEGGKRGGPHDVPGIAGLGAAAREALADMPARAARMRRQATRLARGLCAVPGTRLNGPGPDERLPGHVQVSAVGVEGEAVALAMAARGVAVAPGSACTFGAGKASPVLEAMGADDGVARSAVLMTAGPGTTDDEVDEAIRAYADAVQVLRAMAPS